MFYLLFEIFLIFVVETNNNVVHRDNVYFLIFEVEIKNIVDIN